MKVKCKINTLTEREKGYIFGFYVGDGNIFIKQTTGVYRIRFYLGKNEKEVQEHLKKILLKLFNKLHVYVDRETTICIEIHSKEFINHITTKVSKDGIKHLNKSSKDFLIGFIEGLIDSDGYVKRNYVEITTVNPKLKQQVMKILQMFKVKVNLRSYKYLTKNGEKIGYRIGFSLLCNLFFPVKWKALAAQTAE
ncbi:MAG: hypothetical protein DRJ35_05335 [Thermoprotei archaeon]|nr:MAG: hypothetical protein DRJ35_05335 [Thermoprotei archaeon]